MQKKKERTVEILTLKQHPKGLAVRLALKKKPKSKLSNQKRYCLLPKKQNSIVSIMVFDRPGDHFNK